MKSLVFAIIGIFFFSYTKACDCDQERKPIQELLKSSKTVLIGTVISTKNSNFRDSVTGDTFQEIVLKIDNILIGSSSSTEIIIFTEHSDCGQFLKKGKKYLVYTYWNTRNNFLEIHQCHSPCPEINTEFANKDLSEIKKLKSSY